MPDHIVIKANTSNPVRNGSLITLVFETGTAASGEMPQVNQFVPSGTMQDRLKNRFDEHYGGGDS